VFPLLIHVWPVSLVTMFQVVSALSPVLLHLFVLQLSLRVVQTLFAGARWHRGGGVTLEHKPGGVLGPPGYLTEEERNGGGGRFNRL